MISSVTRRLLPSRVSSLRAWSCLSTDATWSGKPLSRHWSLLLSSCWLARHAYVLKEKQCGCVAHHQRLLARLLPEFGFATFEVEPEGGPIRVFQAREKACTHADADEPASLTVFFLQEAKPEASCIFGRWYQQWMPALVDLFCQGEGPHTRGLHYFLMDVCIALLRWSQAPGAPAHPPATAAATLLRHLVRGAVKSEPL